MNAVIKKPTNLSLQADLLAEAKALDLNLSAELNKALAEIVKRKRAERWLAENREAIEAYNRHIERDGLWSDGLRTF
ncbi:MAG: type II toxin-antitoxin system CcdA family antitoxin [Xanthomonadales bacterium]|nr:type II toxin-antitoxin system CcdA family antitoxin [Xanthomonadales bacterium]